MLKYSCSFTATDISGNEYMSGHCSFETSAEVSEKEVIDYIKILYCEDPHVVKVHINKLNKE